MPVDNSGRRAASRERPVLLPVSLDVRSGLSRRMALGETKHTVNVSRIAPFQNKKDRRVLQKTDRFTRRAASGHQCLPLAKI